VPAVFFRGSSVELTRRIALLQFGRITSSTLRLRDSRKVFEVGVHSQTQAVYRTVIGRFESHARNRRN